MEISRNAIEKADVLKKLFKEKGYRFLLDSPANQIFIVLENDRLERLKKQVNVSFWERADEGHTVVRFATSWATTMEEIEALEELL